MTPEEQNKILKDTRAACIGNAEAFLAVAETTLRHFFAKRLNRAILNFENVA